jgi:transcriptional regulator with XRE-family HTH domain
MREKGISQEKLANMCSVKRPTMNQKLHNVRPISLNEAQIIQEALQIPQDEFGAYFFTA